MRREARDVFLAALIGGSGCAGGPRAEPGPPSTADEARPPAAASGAWPPVHGFCPPYLQSPIRRPRGHRVEVGPRDDWIATLERAPPDTEVVLRRGEYRLGHHHAVRIGPRVTVRGETGDARDVVIQGAGYSIEGEGLMVVGAEVTLAELSVTATRDHAVAIKGERAAHAPHLYRLRLFDVGTQHVKLTPGGVRDGLVACSEIFFTPGAARGDYVDALDLHGAVDWHIRDNSIHGIRGDGSGCAVDVDCGTYVSGPAILVWNGARGTVVERNVLVDNFRNIALGLGRGHEGGLVRDNFIYRAGPGDAGIELQGVRGTRVVHNTVRVAGHPGAIELRQARDVELVNNLLGAPVWDRGDASYRELGTVSGATDTDFEAPAGFRLRPGARAIGAGVPVPDAATDLEGRPRTGRHDAGCSQAP